MIRGHDIGPALAVMSLGIGAFALGRQGFTSQGLPWNNRRCITGISAKAIGACCTILGAALIGFALYALRMGW